LSIHYYRTGGDNPKLIFNHGAGDDGLCWTRVDKELEADYDAIPIDARGHGKSSSGKGDYSNVQRVADLAGLIQALGLERPVVRGHSMGADMCMSFATVHPELRRAIFLEDPPILLLGEKFGDGNLNSMASMGMDITALFEVFKKITVPVLLFIGDKEMMSIVSQESAEKAASVNAKVIHLEGASHDIRHTRFDGYVPALKDFLKNIY
jgi:pimeloyl-ACP methyl ester carboxylesterase